MFDKKEWHKRYYQKNKRYFEKYKKEWYQKNKEQARQYQILKTHGLLHKDWLLIWEEQGDKCAICGELFYKPSNACIDHNHETGEIRGLLCKKCNFGIGLFNDDIKLLKKAIKYLKKKVV